MPDYDRPRTVRGPSRGVTVTVTLSEDELRLVEAYAAERGLSLEAALEELAADGLARRVRTRTGRRPSPWVRSFHRTERA